MIFEYIPPQQIFVKRGLHQRPVSSQHEAHQHSQISEDNLLRQHSVSQSHTGLSNIDEGNSIYIIEEAHNSKLQYKNDE